MKLRSIVKDFGKKRVLNDISLDINEGEFVSILGNSGCGKTTLLRIIAGLDSALSGQVLLEGNDISALPPHLRNTGFVFQNFALFPHKNVFQNIAYGLEMRKVDKASIRVKVTEAIEKLNLTHKITENVSLLSGGEQQRVALARALVIEPKLLLLDEPLSNLDHSMRTSAKSELRRLHKEFSITTIYITHDLSEALTMSDRVAVMNNGSIIQYDTPHKVYKAPNSPFVAKFVGKYNLFSAAEAYHIFQRTIPQGSELAVLPECTEINTARDTRNILISDVLFYGPSTELILTFEERSFRIFVPSENPQLLKKGAHVSLSVSNDNSKILFTTNETKTC